MASKRTAFSFLIACLTRIIAETYFETQIQRTLLPSEVDWRERGAVTPVENQEHCKACWAFAVASAVESHYFIKTGELVRLSAQNLIDCSDVFGNNGCTMGYTRLAFMYIEANQGINYADSYPYKKFQRKCRFNRNDSVVSIRGYASVKPNSEASLIEAVASKGPVVVRLYTSSKFLKYTGGVFFDFSCKKQQHYQIMLLVGYGTDKDDGDYWILKNSFGESWGENGYMKMARNINDTCRLTSNGYFPLI